MWALFALGSAVFAALTSILAKIGIEGVNSNLATAVRTVVVVLMAWGMVARGMPTPKRETDPKSASIPAMMPQTLDHTVLSIAIVPYVMPSSVNRGRCCPAGSSVLARGRRTQALLRRCSCEAKRSLRIGMRGDGRYCFEWLAIA